MRTELEDLYKMCNMLIDKIIRIQDINKEYELLSPAQIDILVNVYNDGYRMKKEIYSLLYISGIE